MYLILPLARVRDGENGVDGINGLIGRDREGWVEGGEDGEGGEGEAGIVVQMVLMGLKVWVYGDVGVLSG